MQSFTNRIHLNLVLYLEVSKCTENKYSFTKWLAALSIIQSSLKQPEMTNYDISLAVKSVYAKAL